MSKFLNPTNLSYLWARIKSTFATKEELSNYHDDTKQDAATAFDGNYNSLSNQPSIPSKTSDLTNDSDFVSDDDYVHTDNNYTTAEKNKLDGIDISTKQDKGKMTVGSMEYTVTRKALTVYNNGTPTTYYLADLTEVNG